LNYTIHCHRHEGFLADEVLGIDTVAGASLFGFGAPDAVWRPCRLSACHIMHRATIAGVTQDRRFQAAFSVAGISMRGPICRRPPKFVWPPENACPESLRPSLLYTDTAATRNKFYYYYSGYI